MNACFSAQAVVVKGQISLPPKTIKPGQQAGIFFVDARPHKFDDGDVVPRLASRTKPLTEHKPEGGLEHCFVCLLKASLFLKSENLVSRNKLLVRTREKAFDLRPVKCVRL